MQPLKKGVLAGAGGAAALTGGAVGAALRNGSAGAAGHGTQADATADPRTGRRCKTWWGADAEEP